MTSLLAIIAVPALALCLWLLRRPGWAFATTIGSLVLFEADTEGFLPVGPFYRSLPGHLFASDILILVTVVAVLGDVARRRRAAPVPRLLVAVLVVMGAALAAGLVVGLTGGGAAKELLDEARGVVYAIVVPLLATQVLRTPSAQARCIEVLAALAVLKGAIGLVGYALGRGRVVDGEHLTYYDPTANFAMLLFLVLVLAAALGRVALPRWMWVGAPLPLLALLLSFRRSFWIAAVLAAVLVVALSVRRRGRAAALVGVAAVVVAVVLALGSFGGRGDLGGSSTGLDARLASLSPSSLQQSNDDRYRIDEDRNVIRSLRSHPVTGLGLGVPWAVTSPLSETHDGGTYYAHVNLFWFYLKLGPLGALAYAMWYVAAVVLGLRGWRRHPDPLLRAAALAGAVSMVGLAVAETTASFTGIDDRFTPVVAALVGLLAATSVPVAGVRSAPGGQGGGVGLDGPVDHLVEAEAPRRLPRLAAGAT